jgi:hypothetical protein
MVSKMKKMQQKEPVAPIIAKKVAKKEVKTETGEAVKNLPFTIYLPPSMKKDLRMIQMDQDKTMNKIVLEAISNHIKNVGFEGK